MPKTLLILYQSRWGSMGVKRLRRCGSLKNGIKILDMSAKIMAALAKVLRAIFILDLSVLLKPP